MAAAARPRAAAADLQPLRGAAAGRAHGAGTGSWRGGVPGVQGPEAGRAAVRERRAIAARCWPKRSSGSPTRSTRSSAASSRRRRTMSGGARRAASRRCAGRTTSAMSEPRLPFDDDAARSRIAIADADATVRPQSVDPAAATCPTRRLARVRRRSVAERRPRGLGRHRQDARAGRALRQPAARRHRAGPHPGHHLHAQGRRRDAAAHRRSAEGSEPALGIRRRALARSEGAARRHRGLDDRRLLSAAAARVPARGRRRSRIRSRGQHRGAAAGRRVARSGAAHLPRPRARGRRRRAGVRAARRAAAAQPASRRCSTAVSSRRTRCGGFCRRVRAT